MATSAALAVSAADSSLLCYGESTHPFNLELPPREVWHTLWDNRDWVIICSTFLIVTCRVLAHFDHDPCHLRCLKY